ncbi:MAG: pyridoxamine 5'-phosphate oxidase family protein [Thermodesulfovibrionia bacterium]|nr:pyridoxamine 5'-phosphate oxidase family protein [Thermodesulfovibrionia bacterium]
MGDLKERIFEAAKELQLINVATITEDGKPWVRYVMGKADKDLSFRFCTHLESRKVPQINNNPNVHVTLGVSSLETAKSWLQIQGTAKVSTDQTERDAFWFDELNNFFSGPKDPSYCIVIIRPSRIELGTMGSMNPEVWKPGV